MKRVMLYFGSFNPPHLGHLAIAEYVVSEGISDEVWFVVSPQNPLKKQQQLAPETDRLAMTEFMIAASPLAELLHICDVEFRMARPSYTIDTLHLLASEYPEIEFLLLIGSDVAAQFEQWKSWQEIAANYNIYVYPREGYDFSANFRWLNAPVLPISSTLVRQTVENGGFVAEMVADSVASYIEQHGLYCKDYLESGKEHYARGEFGAALNDFMRAQEVGENSEAANFEQLVRDILAFRYTDIYNP